MNMIDLIVCHLIGDFLLQNHWMQTKSKSSWVCLVHVIAYSLPFVLAGVAWKVVALIAIQHWLQDRFALHLKWMRLIQQTTPDMWPAGPLYVDQSLHIAWIAFVFWSL